jgi:hypothetical protein
MSETLGLFAEARQVARHLMAAADELDRQGAVQQ